ncbi:MAG: phospholipase [Planctomycetota bacterium]
MPDTLPLHAVHAEPRTPSGAPPLLILFHGFGSHELDLFALKDHLDPRCRIVSARAPLDLAPAGMPGGYAWFELIFRPEGIDYDRDSADRGAELAGEFVRSAIEHFETPPERTFLCGFSQGAMMCHAIALAPAHAGGAARLGGIAALSGRAVDAVFTPDRDWRGLDGFPVFVAHGVHDDVIPIARGGRAIRDYYAGSPVELTYHEYDAAHTIPPDNLADLAAWLTAQIDTLTDPA